MTSDTVKRKRTAFCGIVLSLTVVLVTTRSGSAGTGPQPSGTIVWGAVTNGIKVGLEYYEVVQRGPPKRECRIYTIYGSTNYSAFSYPNLWYSPEPESSYAVTLRDGNSKKVQLTPVGRKYGKPLSLKKLRSSAVWHPWFPDRAREEVNFNIDEFFKITKEDEYELEVQLRLYRRVLGQKYLQPFSLPPVTMKVRLKPQRNKNPSSGGAA